MSEIFNDLAGAVAEITRVVDERHEKYGSTNIANSPGGPLNGLRVRLHDKLARLNNYVDNGGTADFTDDKLRDCFIDIAGYALIGLLVLDGRWPGLEKPEPEEETFVNTPPVVWSDEFNRYVTVTSAVNPDQFLINTHLNEGSR